nr:hypothetical protein HmN_000335600 [Hymenolepis microstoma]
MKTSADWLRLTGFPQILMAKRLLVSDTMVPTFKSVSGELAVEDRHGGREEEAGLKMQNWRPFLVKIHVVKLKKNYQNHWVGMREQAMRMNEKEGYWVPHELKPRDVE